MNVAVVRARHLQIPPLRIAPAGAKWARRGVLDDFIALTPPENPQAPEAVPGRLGILIGHDLQLCKADAGTESPNQPVALATNRERYGVSRGERI